MKQHYARPPSFRMQKSLGNRRPGTFVHVSKTIHYAPIETPNVWTVNELGAIVEEPSRITGIRTFLGMGKQYKTLERVLRKLNREMFYA